MNCVDDSVDVILVVGMVIITIGKIANGAVQTECFFGAHSAS